MQYAPLVLAVFLVGVTFSQNWDTDQFEDVGKGDNNLDFDTTLAKQDEDRKNKEDPIMERVAKGGIRPKLALSSRLWGR
uniref:Uncharacterized protein n=1 Tax=Caenorhabditis japonica TaxID=281687 RepID=A0A8R1DGT0_CAEJA